MLTLVHVMTMLSSTKLTSNYVVKGPIIEAFLPKQTDFQNDAKFIRDSIQRLP